MAAVCLVMWSEPVLTRIIASSTRWINANSTRWINADNTKWIAMHKTITNFHKFFFSFLASGDSYNTLAARFQLGVTTVHRIIHDTCDVIWNMLQEAEIPEPTRKHWVKIEQRFHIRWNFPNCVGALDGKHCVIQAPNQSGSLESIL